ncbi:hypothetical protein J0X14_04335 [Muricauda sp. CAU 1633]|uniref:hypothetical protein n=1 Tax=Allomuricauda sp. CAU 1633 TaxID=2816036 RepID=UPI001A8F3D3A|nr:hypothetical protein [Muricauda sp. CAU 1633]MBO0321516.1 hypothetical protein [Muricauda sp. CAU 1633]
MNFKLITISILLSLNASMAFAQTPLLNPEKIRNRVKTEKLLYIMSHEKDSAGYTALEYRLDGDTLMAGEEVEAVYNGINIYEKLSSTFNLDSAEMVEAELFMKFGENTLNFNGKWLEGGAIAIKYNTLDSLITDSGENHIERFQSLFVLPRLIHESDSIITYRQFNPTDLQFRSITATPLGQTEISSSLGMFTCAILQLQGGVAVQKLFVDITSHRIVRIEIPHQSWVYDLIGINSN